MIENNKDIKTFRFSQQEVAQQHISVSESQSNKNILDNNSHIGSESRKETLVSGDLSFGCRAKLSFEGAKDFVRVEQHESQLMVVQYAKGKHLIGPNEYDLSKPYDRACLSALEYPQKYQQTVRNQLVCSKAMKIYWCPEVGCQHEYRTLLHCNTTFCKENSCVVSRIAKSKERLNTLPEYFTRVYHFEIGSNLLTRAELKFGVYKWIMAMRRKGYKLEYIKVFDISKKNYEETLKYWLHYHVALLPESKLRDARQFMAKSKKTLGHIDKRLLFHNEGFRSRKAIFNYFAQRIAGRFGRKGSYYYYPDIISRHEWFSTHYMAKNMTKALSVRLSRINGTNSSVPRCPLHGCDMVFAYSTYDLEEIARKPPGWGVRDLGSVGNGGFLLEGKSVVQGFVEEEFVGEVEFSDLAVCGNCRYFDGVLCCLHSRSLWRAVLPSSSCINFDELR